MLKLENQEGYPDMYYDAIDMRNNYRRGFWIGAVSGTILMFTLCLIVGVFAIT